ncbi:hypothetical protein BJX99DRAFT_97439 [Aspergillus californicus]
MENVASDHNPIDQPPQQLATPLDSPGTSSLSSIRRFPSPNVTSPASEARVAIPRVAVPERPQPRITRACVLCQKKKTKCDGRKPKCGFCLRSGTVCVYSKSKRENQQLQLHNLEDKINAYEALLQDVFSQSGQDGRRLIQDAMKKHFQASPDFFSTFFSSRPAGLSLGRLHQTWQSNQKSPTLVLLREPPIRTRSIQNWTSLVDNDVASHLLSLYFTWENPTWQLVDQSLFLHDLEHGRTKFCTRLLVHTLLFFGCSFSYSVSRITDRREEKALGEKLYAAIQHLWLEVKDSVDLPTAQSSILIGLLCCTFGIDKIGTKYIMHGAEISSRLNIQMENSSYLFCDSDDPAAVLNCQKLVSWAIFDLQALACQVYRKQPVWDGAPCVKLSQEEAAVLDEMVEWRPYPFQAPVCQPFFYTASWIRSELVVIVDDIARFSLRLSGSKLADHDWDYGSTLYQRLLGWSTKLPWSVLPQHNTTPHVLCLHLYYHATIVSLCEIFLATPDTSASTLHHFNPSPIKSQALDAIGSLVLLFKHSHGWKSIPIVMLHYFCVAGVHAATKLHPTEPKWSLVLESSVVGLWHMSLGWGRLCKAFLRTIDLVLKARNPDRNSDPALVSPKVKAIFGQLGGDLWTRMDASALAADYMVHHVPDSKAQTLQDLLVGMGGLSVSKHPEHGGVG